MVSTRLLEKVLWRGEVDGSAVGGDIDPVSHSWDLTEPRNNCTEILSGIWHELSSFLRESEIYLGYLGSHFSLVDEISLWYLNRNCTDSVFQVAAFIVLIPHGVFNAWQHHTGLLSPPIQWWEALWARTMGSYLSWKSGPCCRVGWRQESPLHRQQELNSVTWLSKGIKLLLHCGMMRRCSTWHSWATSVCCQPQPSGRYFPAFDYSALPNVLTLLLEVTELAKSASLGLSHCLHSDRCEMTVTATGWAHML